MPLPGVVEAKVPAWISVTESPGTTPTKVPPLTGAPGVPLYTLAPTTVPTTLKKSGVIAPVSPTGCVMV